MLQSIAASDITTSSPMQDDQGKPLGVSKISLGNKLVTTQ